MSIELTETNQGGRRLSFTEAIESSRQTSPQPAETDVDAKPSVPSPLPPITPLYDAPKTVTTSSFEFKLPNMEIPSIFTNKIFWIVVAVLLAIPLLLIVILVPLHFADLEYWEIGFVMQRSTGEVDTDEVYGPGGRHGIGPDFTFKTFPADAQYAVLADLSVFSRDRLEIFLSLTFQYFIRPDELRPLHDAYDQQYHEIIVSRAETVIKATSPRFNTTEYFVERATVESTFTEELFNDLGGMGCCDSYCSGDLYDDYEIYGIECNNCNRTCPQEAQRFHVDVRYFQLLSVRIPNEVSQQYLNQIILIENAEQEQFIQDAAVETLLIERDVQEIMNDATELTEEATANAALIRARATANATAIVEDARNGGLAMIYQQLNITNPKHKASLDYLRTLRRSSTNVRLHVGFDTTVSGPYNE